MNKITITLHLELDAAALSPDLASQLAALVATVQEAPEPAAKRKRGRPRKDAQADNWQRFDALVRDEMERLAEHERMPETRRWNNERSAALPTMAEVMRRYGVPNLLQLAEQLEMRPPLSALGVAPYGSTGSPTDDPEVTDE